MSDVPFVAPVRGFGHTARRDTCWATPLAVLHEGVPRGIHITDNAIIPLKERVVDEFYDPVMRLLKVFRRRS
jgi:hypothetical protein